MLNSAHGQCSTQYPVSRFCTLRHTHVQASHNHKCTTTNSLPQMLLMWHPTISCHIYCGDRNTFPSHPRHLIFPLTHPQYTPRRCYLFLFSSSSSLVPHSSLPHPRPWSVLSRFLPFGRSNGVLCIRLSPTPNRPQRIPHCFPSECLWSL